METHVHQLVSKDNRLFQTQYAVTSIDQRFEICFLPMVLVHKLKR